MLVFYAITYAHHWARPTESQIGSGWWGWSDQRHYYEAARAWAYGDLRSSVQWYLPGYPLIGGLFYWLYPTNPFVLPDALFLVLSLILFVRICEALGIGQFWAVGIFVLSSVVPSHIFDQYENPWTSTPVVPLIFGILLAAIRYYASNSRKHAAIAGACLGLISLFRPSDLIVAAPVIVFSIFHAWRAGGVRQVFGDGLAFFFGFVATGACSAAIYLAVYGPEVSGYIRQEHGKGFYVSGLANKWVEIFLDPNPLYPGGEGILHAYPWAALGLVGAVQSVFLRRGQALRLIAATTVIYIALYLSYGALSADGLWWGNNLHYFKWTFPILAMLGFLALKSLYRRENWSRFAAAFAISAVLLCLHLTPESGRAVSVSRLGGGGFMMNFGEAPQPIDAIDVPLAAGRDRRAQSPVSDVWVNGKPAENWTVLTPSGVRVGMLHRANATQLRLQLPQGYVLSPSDALTTTSMRISLGWPCWLVSWPSAPD